MDNKTIGCVLLGLLAVLSGQTIIQAQGRSFDRPARENAASTPAKAGEPASALKAVPLAPKKTDLALVELTLSREKPEVGEAVEIQVVVQNLGDTDVPRAKVQLFLDRRLLAEHSVTLMRAKTKVRVKFSFKADSPGPQTLRVVANPDGLTSEANQVNNTIQRVLAVLPPPVARMKEPQPAIPPTALKMGSVKGALPSSGKVLYDVVTPNLVVKVVSAAVQGQHSSVTLKITNQGTGVAPPFKAGIFTAGPSGAPEGTAFIKGAVNTPLGPGLVHELKITFPPGLIFLANQKFVAVVDVDNDVQEGTPGENDNITPPFALSAALTIIAPLDIDQFEVLNTKLLPGEEPIIFATILGGPVTAWQVSYVFADGKEFIAKYEKNPFPAMTNKAWHSIPIPFAVWPTGSPAKPGEKATVSLAVANASGQVAKKGVTVTFAESTFAGSMSIAGVVWKVNGTKLESVSVNVSYTANEDFLIGEYGHPLYGSVWISLQKYQTFGYSGISSGMVSLGVCSPKSGNLDYPKTIIKKGPGNFTVKCLLPSAEIKGVLEIYNVWKDAQGITTKATDLVCRGCNFFYPTLRVGLSFFTPSAAKGDYKDVEIKDAFLDKKTLNYWMEDIGTTAYVCTPCPPGY